MKHSAECWRGNYKEGAELIEPEASGVSGMKIEGEEDGQEYRRIDEIFESPPLDGDGDLLAVVHRTMMAEAADGCLHS